MTMISKKATPFDLINVLLMLLMMFTMVYPLYYIIVGSLNEGQDLMRGGVYFFPRTFTLDNYRAVFYDQAIISALLVTVAKTVVGTVTSVLFTALVAYGITRPKLKLKKLYIPIIMFTMFFGGGLIPYFMLIMNIGLYDSFWVYIIPSLFSVWYMIIFMSFIREIPDSLIESAKMDGAGEYRIFIQIILPLAKPALAAVALFTAVSHWNAYFDSMMYTFSPALQTIQLYLMRVITDPSASSGIGLNVAQLLPGAAQRITPQTIKLATMVVTAMPIVIIYPFLQKYFVKGVLIGSVKG